MIKTIKKVIDEYYEENKSILKPILKSLNRKRINFIPNEIKEFEEQNLEYFKQKLLIISIILFLIKIIKVILLT